MPKDTKLYELLNVPVNANESEIRKAYYKLAKVHHPDKSAESDEKAEEKFKEIKFAYEVLTDKGKREIYDNYGLEGLKDGVGGTEFEGIFSNLFGAFGGMRGDNPFFPFDLFGGGGGRSRQKRKTQNMVYPLKISLEELYNGGIKMVDYERSCLCKKCGGTGGKPGATKNCTSCNGRGFTMQFKQLGPGMVQQMQAICRECSGEGEIINEKDRCKECNGKKTVKEKKVIEVHIDKGMSDGQKITFRGESNQEPDVESGDFIVVLQQEEHNLFKRSHDDLFVSHKINITEALCGFNFVIKHLDGRSLVLKNPQGSFISPNLIKGIVKEGMPIYRNPYEKGNLYVRFEIAFPENNSLSEEAIEKIESLLPRRPEIEIPNGENVEEVSMVEFHSTRGTSSSNARSSGAHSHRQFGFMSAESDDDEAGEGQSGQHVNCNTQ